jgi:predicted dinucleotide-binding enzyme
MNIGIIGSGEMGKCLAGKLTKLGHIVSIANSRGPGSLQQVVGDTGAKAVTVEEATRNQEVIIVSIPLKNVSDLAKYFKNLSRDVAVADTGNYYPTLRDGQIKALNKSGIDTLWVQQQLGVSITKVFNSILATSLETMGRPKGNKDRIALPISGDSIKAKKVISILVDELGFDAVDLGAIAQSWKQQPGSTIYCRDLKLEEMRIRLASLGSDWQGMRDAILAKRKADEATDYPAYLTGLKT